MDDIERFTEGDCHWLAKAIHDQTGWPIHAFYLKNRETETGKPRHDLHAFVMMPDGRVLDVEGPQTLKSFKKKWQAKTIKEAKWSQLKSWGGPWFDDTEDRAPEVARELLASLA